MIILDTETTGLLRPSATAIFLQPYMIEIAAVKVNKKFEPVAEFLSLVKPPVPIPDEIIGITGITNEMVVKAPPFALIYDELCDFFLGEQYVFAHNCAFDMSIIQAELARMGMEYHFPWPKNHICTVEKSMPIQNKRLKLSALYNIATGKKEFPNAHRAMSDVLALLECVKFLAENDFL
jgi:DNA polymerase III epsilon subunit-like protein